MYVWGRWCYLLSLSRGRYCVGRDKRKYDVASTSLSVKDITIANYDHILNINNIENIFAKTNFCRTRQCH